MVKSYSPTHFNNTIKLKGLRVLTIWIFCLTLILNGCSDDDPSQDPITTDISVSSSASSIAWIDAMDLTQKLENALTFNYGSALESEIEETVMVASDSTQVMATIDFKEAFQDNYKDPNTSNNSITISLEKEIDPGNAVELNADGPGNTYDLITSVLAPGFDPIEVPDCSHPAFGEHIDELFDNELNTNVFRFYIHRDPDNDRCINFDRQRNEIKT